MEGRELQRVELKTHRLAEFMHVEAMNGNYLAIGYGDGDIEIRLVSNLEEKIFECKMNSTKVTQIMMPMSHNFIFLCAMYEDLTISCQIL